MSIRSLRSVVLMTLAVGALAACGGNASTESSSTVGAAATTEAVSGSSAVANATVTATDATVARHVISPEGRVEGLLLKDGTVVRFPHSSKIDESVIAVGDAIHLEGKTISTPTGSLVMRPIVSKAGAVVADFSAEQEPQHGPHGHGPGGFGPPGGFGHGGMPQLAAMTSTGTIEAVLSGPHGHVEALILSDGTTARIPRHHHGADQSVSFKVGDAVTLDGHGTVGTAGKGMFIQSVKLASGETRELAPPPPVVTALDKSGEIQTAIVNPFGGVDSLVLTDGTVVRVPPFASSAKLVAGTKIQITGSTVGTFAHAEKITSASGEVLLTMPTEPPQRPERVELTDLNVEGTVAKILTSPMGGPDTLILKTGEVIKVPPPMQHDLGTELTEGAIVKVSGKGGKYDAGTSLFAKSITLPSGKTVAAPEREHGGDCKDRPADLPPL